MLMERWVGSSALFTFCLGVTPMLSACPLHLGDLIFAQLVHPLKDVIFVYTLAQCYETFYGRNLQMFKISESVVPARPFQPSLMIVCKARILY